MQVSPSANMVNDRSYSNLDLFIECMPDDGVWDCVRTIGYVNIMCGEYNVDV